MATRKQKKVAKIILENPGISTAKAMREAGYSENTIVDPKNVLESKGFLELFTEAIPESDLIEAHKAGLESWTNKPHLVDRDDKGRPVYDYVPEPDFHARHKYLETAYKLKGRLTGLNGDQMGNISINLALYEQNDRHTLPVQTKGLSITVPVGNGRRMQESGDNLAPKKREGQDSPPGGSEKDVA